MNEKMKTYLSNIRSAYLLLEDTENSIIKETQQASNIRKAILENHDLILWEMFGQSAVTVNSEEKAVSSDKLLAGQERLLNALKRRGYAVTIKTLQKETGLTAATIHNYVPALRKAGHKIAVFRNKGGLPMWSYKGKAA